MNNVATVAVRRTCKRTAVACAVALAVAAPGAWANGNSTSDEIGALKATVEALQKEVKELRALVKGQGAAASKQELDAVEEQVKSVKKDVAETKKVHSEWKDATSVVHLAGYGSVGYSDQKTGDGRFDQVQFSPIFHYQYDDLLMLESELEITTAEDGETEVELEYLALDLFANDYLTVVAGKFLSPLGQFRQNLHPSWINKMPSAPPGFGHGGAAPLSEVGLQARGGFPLGGARANYALYVGNGPEVEVEGVGGEPGADEEVHADGLVRALAEEGEAGHGEGAEPEIHAIEAEGRTSDRDGNKVWGGRFGVLPVPGLEVGVSAAAGKVGLFGSEPIPGEPDRDYTVLGADFAYQRGPLDVRGEYIEQKVGADPLSMLPDEAKFRTWYVQGAYKFLPTKWEAVVRYGDLTTPEGEGDLEQWAAGINYLFAGNVIAKLAFESNTAADGSAADEDRWLAQFAYGF